MRGNTTVLFQPGDAAQGLTLLAEHLEAKARVAQESEVRERLEKVAGRLRLRAGQHLMKQMQNKG